jgi:hypothetical protein
MAALQRVWHLDSVPVLGSEGGTVAVAAAVAAKGSGRLRAVMLQIVETWAPCMSICRHKRFAASTRIGRRGLSLAAGPAPLHSQDGRR